MSTGAATTFWTATTASASAAGTDHSGRTKTTVLPITSAAEGGGASSAPAELAGPLNRYLRHSPGGHLDMADSVDRVFVHALNTVKKIPRTGSARPPPRDRLKLYGLYKQSMEGDVDGVMERPTGESEEAQAEREKWDSWHQQKGLSKTEAKRRYISTLIDTMHKYASTTPDARELVSELEFVWDQIKSNVPSSSSSSPPRPLRVAVPKTSQFSNRSFGDGEPLRVLSPVSQPTHGIDEDMSDDGHDGRVRDYDPTSAVALGGGDSSRSTQRWRRRVEVAMTRMTAEVAALREQIEISRRNSQRKRNAIFAWFWWFLTVAWHHILVDAALLGAAIFWFRRRGDPRLEMGLKMGAMFARIKAKQFVRKLIRSRRTDD